MSYSFQIHHILFNANIYMDYLRESNVSIKL